MSQFSPNMGPYFNPMLQQGWNPAMTNRSGMPGMFNPVAAAQPMGPNGMPFPASGTPLENPLAELLPTPMNMLKGSLVGLASVLTMHSLMGGEANNGPWIQAAKAIDKLPGLNWLSEKLQNATINLSEKHPRLQQVFMSNVGDVDEATTIANMEKEQVARLFSTFGDRITNEDHYTEFLNKERSAIQANYKERLNKVLQDYKEPLDQAKQQNKKLIQDALAKMETWGDKIPEFHLKESEHLKNLNFTEAMTLAEAKASVLEKLEPTKENKRLAHVLLGLKERISGLNNFYKPIYASHTKLSRQLAQENVGPIGRGMALVGSYLLRILNGETMAAPKGFFSMFNGGLFGPVFAGLMIFGLSFNKADKAEKGDKTKTFFQDFIGNGIANFIGWEFGRKFLNSSGLVQKLLGKRSTKILPKFLGKWTIPWIGTFTLGGVVTEITSALVFGNIFQKVGEGISHVIFGKPKEPEKDAAAKAMNPLLAGNPSPYANPANGYNPAQAFYPAAQPTAFGAVNPANAWARQPQAQPQQLAQTTPQNGNPMMLPRQAQGFPQSATNYAAETPISVTPDAIMNSEAAKQMSSMEAEILGKIQASNRK